MPTGTEVRVPAGRATLHADAAERPVLEEWIREHGSLAAAAATRPEVEARRGRGRVLVVPAPVGEGRWVIRHYRRGGALASLLGDRYPRIGTPRPVRELRVGRVAAALGVPTPEHIAAAVYPAGIWYRGDLVTRWVPGSRDLARILFGRSDFGDPVAEAPAEGGARGDTGPAASGAEPAMAAAGRLVRRLHDAGVDHPDLNLKNVLIAGPPGDPDALVLDLDRARIRTRLTDARRRSMLARFWRSAGKWEARTGVALPPSLRQAFEAGYSDRPGG
jgi:3-deoxy-D-manno-octulosonic acid kinase